MSKLRLLLQGLIAAGLLTQAPSAFASEEEVPEIDVLSYEELLELSPANRQVYLEGLQKIVFQIAEDQGRYPYFDASSESMARRYPFIAQIFFALPFPAEAKSKAKHKAAPKSESEELKRAREEQKAAEADLRKAIEDRDRLKTSQGEAPPYILKEIKESEAKVEEAKRKVSALQGPPRSGPNDSTKWADPVAAANASTRSAFEQRERDKAEIDALRAAGNTEQLRKAERAFEERERLGCYSGRQDGRAIDAKRCGFTETYKADGQVQLTDRCGKTHQMKSCSSFTDEQRRTAQRRLSRRKEVPSCTSGFNPAEGLGDGLGCKLTGRSIFGNCESGFSCSHWIYGAIENAGKFESLCAKTSGGSTINNENNMKAMQGACEAAKKEASDRHTLSYNFMHASISSNEKDYEGNFSQLFRRICGSPQAKIARCETCTSLIAQVSELNQQVNAACPTAARHRRSPGKKSRARH